MALMHLYPQLKTGLAQNPGGQSHWYSYVQDGASLVRVVQCYLVLRGFAVVHSSGIWCNHLTGHFEQRLRGGTKCYMSGGK